MRTYENSRQIFDEMRSQEQSGQVFTELGCQIYAALREDVLDAKPVVELARLLEEVDRRTSAVREILDRPTAHLTTADVTRLGRRLLDDINFEPTFALEPRLWAALEQALEIVERDVRATGITGLLRLVILDQDGHARVEFQGGCQGNGISPGQAGDAQGALAQIADATQEVVMEMVWAAWPICPMHDLGLSAGLEHEKAVWRCSGGETHTVARVGELPSPHR
jgi:hypothetical protein